MGVVAKAHTREKKKRKEGKKGKKRGVRMSSAPSLARGRYKARKYEIKERGMEKKGRGEEKERRKGEGRGEKRGGGEGGNSPIISKIFRGQAPVPPFPDLLGGHPSDPPG